MLMPCQDPSGPFIANGAASLVATVSSRSGSAGYAVDCLGNSWQNTVTDKQNATLALVLRTATNPLQHFNIDWPINHRGHDRREQGGARHRNELTGYCVVDGELSSPSGLSRILATTKHFRGLLAPLVGLCLGRRGSDQARRLTCLTIDVRSLLIEWGSVRRLGWAADSALIARLVLGQGSGSGWALV